MRVLARGFGRRLERRGVVGRRVRRCSIAMGKGCRVAALRRRSPMTICLRQCHTRLCAMRPSVSVPALVGREGAPTPNRTAVPGPVCGGFLLVPSCSNGRRWQARFRVTHGAESTLYPQQQFSPVRGAHARPIDKASIANTPLPVPASLLSWPAIRGQRGEEGEVRCTAMNALAVHSAPKTAAPARPRTASLSSLHFPFHPIPTHSGVFQRKGTGKK